MASVSSVAFHMVESPRGGRVLSLQILGRRNCMMEPSLGRPLFLIMKPTLEFVKELGWQTRSVRQLPTLRRSYYDRTSWPRCPSSLTSRSPSTAPTIVWSWTSLRLRNPPLHRPRFLSWCTFMVALSSTEAPTGRSLMELTWCPSPCREDRQLFPWHWTIVSAFGAS